MKLTRYTGVIICALMALTLQVVNADQKANKDFIPAHLVKPIRVKMNLYITQTGSKPISYSTEQVVADGENTSINHNSSTQTQGGYVNLSIDSVLIPEIVNDMQGRKTISIKGNGQLRYDTFSSSKSIITQQLAKSFPVGASLKPGETKTIMAEHTDSPTGDVFLKVTLTATIEKGFVQISEWRRSTPSKPVAKTAPKDNKQAEQAGNAQPAQPKEDKKDSESINSPKP